MNTHESRHRSHIWKTTRALIIAGMLAFGCGDNMIPGATPDASAPDAPGPDAGGDQQAPQAQIIFPPVMGVTDSAEIMVRGTASDASGVASIRVNGVEAQTSDEYAEWTVNVPLSHGINELLVEAVDVHGNRDESAAAVPVRLAAYPALHMEDIVADAANDRFLITDLLMGAVLAVDATTGEHTLLSSPSRGSGPDLSTSAITVSSATDGPVYVSQRGAWGVLAVDPDTGDRSVVTGAARGTGPTIASVNALAVHPDDSRVLVLDQINQAIIAVDPGTGDRAYLSGGGAGNGPNFGLIADMTLDASNERALVVDRMIGGLVAVDLVTGDRTIVSDGSVGGGVLFQDPGAVAVDPAGQVAWIVDIDARAVVAVDLTTGMRQLVSSASMGSGPMFVTNPQLAYRISGEGLLMLDREVMYSLEVSSGDRSVFFDFNQGAGMYRYGSPEALAWDAAGGRLYVADPAYGRDAEIDAIVSVSIDSGDRELISSGSSEGVEGMVLDGQRLVITDSQGESLVAVDTITGARMNILVSSDSGIHPHDVAVDEANDRYLFTDRGDNGDAIRTVARGDGGYGTLAAVGGGPQGLVVDAAGNRVFVAHVSANTIIAYDLNTGVSTVISSAGAVAVGEPGELALDVKNNRLLAVGGSEGLYGIDIATGERYAISNASTGRGPLWRFEDLALDSDNDVVAVLDSRLDAVLLIDAKTGDRIIISR